MNTAKEFRGAWESLGILTKKSPGKMFELGRFVISVNFSKTCSRQHLQIDGTLRTSYFSITKLQRIKGDLSNVEGVTTVFTIHILPFSLIIGKY